MGPLSHKSFKQPVPAAEETVFPLPFLLANPSAVQHVENAAQFLGTTYQHVANQLISAYAQCGDCTDACYQQANDAITAMLNDTTGKVDEIAQAVKQDLTLHCNTVTSHVENFFGTCETNALDAATKLQPGHCLLVDNAIPRKPSNWGSAISWEQFTSFIPPNYFMDSIGNVISRVRINQDGSLTLGDNSTFRVTNETDPAALAAFIASWGDGTPPPQCTFTDSFACSTTPPVTPPVVPVPISPKPRPGTHIPPPPPPPSKVCPDGSIIAPDKDCPTPVVVVGGEGPEECCPPQQIIVPAPIVNVTVMPAVCPPAQPVEQPQPAPVTSGAFGGEQQAVSWEPDVHDLIEQLLNTVGFPKDFVESYGTYVKGQLQDDLATATALPDQDNWDEY